MHIPVIRFTCVLTCQCELLSLTCRAINNGQPEKARSSIAQPLENCPDFSYLTRLSRDCNLITQGCLIFSRRSIKHSNETIYKRSYIFCVNIIQPGMTDSSYKQLTLEIAKSLKTYCSKWCKCENTSHDALSDCKKAIFT